MNNCYLKLFVDARERYKKLSDAEFGRLIRAALTYKADGVEMSLTGREELMWDGLKLDIDRDNERQMSVNKLRAEAGRKGAESRWQKDGKNSKCHLPYSKNGYDKDKDKDKEKEEDITPLLSPQGEKATAISLPLVSGDWYPVYETDMAHWKELYPSVDIMQELRKMLGWLEANPDRRKTPKGIKRFVASWLAKEQSKAPPKKTASYDIDELEEISKFNLPEEM